MTTPIDELVRGHAFLADLPGDVVDELVGCAKNAAFSVGERLLSEGDVADTLYLVRRGRVAIEVHTPDRGSVVIETVGPGAVVGWSWLVPPYRWTFDARAIEPVGAIALDGACLRAKAQADPALGFALVSRIAATLLRRLQETRVRLLDLYGGGRAP